MESPDFDNFEQELAVEHAGVWQRLTDRVRWLEGRRPWVIGTGVVGAFVGSLSRAAPNETAGLLMARIAKARSEGANDQALVAQVRALSKERVDIAAS